MLWRDQTAPSSLVQTLSRPCGPAEDKIVQVRALAGGWARFAGACANPGVNAQTSVAASAIKPNTILALSPLAASGGLRMHEGRRLR
jgi:hypothetical protein